MKQGDKVTVLLSSAGATNAVNVIKALRKSNLNVRIIGADCSSMSAGLFLADRGYIVPRADDPGFAQAIISICEEESVDVALPIYSADFPAFRKNLDKFRRSGIRTYAPTDEAWALCNDKKTVSDFLCARGIPSTITWDVDEILENGRNAPYPLFMKLRTGSGTKDTRVIKNRRELEFFADSGHVFQRLLEGQEYTIDMLSTLRGKVMASCVRKRERVRGGLSVVGTTVGNPEISRYAERIASELRLPGPSNVQCIRHNGTPVFYDINPRFASGGLPLAVAAGFNIPALLVRMLMGWNMPKAIRPKMGLTMIRHWDAVFAVPA